MWKLQNVLDISMLSLTRHGATTFGAPPWLVQASHYCVFIKMKFSQPMHRPKTFGTAPVVYPEYQISCRWRTVIQRCEMSAADRALSCGFVFAVMQPIAPHHKPRYDLNTSSHAHRFSRIVGYHSSRPHARCRYASTVARYYKEIYYFTTAIIIF